ncbi:hypothetical protein DD595_25615, partial [Enterobacter cloacae complex sp. 4DZ3-17B2]|uniref:hypothetical protein n=1 Tax=Enterobacter cloacae complex sp. 4DZ3-17B2 TaxID=2511990 RepID=UPI00102719ED
FAEDYRKIVVNAKHELILTRSKHDDNAIIQIAEEHYKIETNKIEWLVPYVTLAGRERIQLLRFIEKDPCISLSFRTWELYENPLLPVASSHVWSVKIATQLEKPRYIIIGFQTARKNDKARNASLFDHCNISNVKVFLNSKYYAYGNLNLDIANNQFSLYM